MREIRIVLSDGEVDLLDRSKTVSGKTNKETFMSGVRSELSKRKKPQLTASQES